MEATRRASMKRCLIFPDRKLGREREGRIVKIINGHILLARVYTSISGQIVQMLPLDTTDTLTIM